MDPESPISLPSDLHGHESDYHLNSESHTVASTTPSKRLQVESILKEAKKHVSNTDPNKGHCLVENCNPSRGVEFAHCCPWRLTKDASQVGCISRRCWSRCWASLARWPVWNIGGIWSIRPSTSILTTIFSQICPLSHSICLKVDSASSFSQSMPVCTACLIGRSRFGHFCLQTTLSWNSGMCWKNQAALTKLLGENFQLSLWVASFTPLDVLSSLQVHMFSILINGDIWWRPEGLYYHPPTYCDHRRHAAHCPFQALHIPLPRFPGCGEPPLSPFRHPWNRPQAQTSCSRGCQLYVPSLHHSAQGHGHLRCVDV